MSSEQGPGGPEITALLVAVENGDRGAFDRLFEAVYTELRSRSRRASRRRPEPWPWTIRTSPLPESIA